MRKSFPELTESYNKYHFFQVGFLSNWFTSHFTDTFTGVHYSCVEQYMMHRKALLFGDERVAEKILSTSDPAECKRLGREVSGFNPEVWDKEARAIVYEGCWYKFTQNPKLLKLLKSTVGTLLVEASAIDGIWGIGMGANDFGVQDPRNWKGRNWLGQVLTHLRDDLDS